MRRLQVLGALWQRIAGFVRSRFAFIVVAGVSVVAGLCMAAGYATVIDYTNSLNFCAHSCHEMQSTVYAEYTRSKHFKNAQGVVVVCTDCHVPHNNWLAVLATKFTKSLEIWHHYVDREYIPEKFNARRPILEKRVWAHFAADNAAECKACHKFGNMVLEDQNPAARAMHTQAMKTDGNCLDCHKGLVHTIVGGPAEAPLASYLTAAAQKPAIRGQEVYAKSCAACHDNLAPKLGDKAAWEPLIKLGDDALVAATIHGKGAMPPRGGDPALSDNDIKAAVEYMESKVQ